MNPVNPYDRKIYEEVIKPIETAVNKAVTNTANTINNAGKAVVNTVVESANGWGNSYSKAVSQVNSSYTKENGVASAITAVATKAKPGPTAIAEATLYVSNVAVKTVSNAIDYFLKGKK